MKNIQVLFFASRNAVVRSPAPDKAAEEIYQMNPSANSTMKGRALSIVTSTLKEIDSLRSLAKPGRQRSNVVKVLRHHRTEKPFAITRELLSRIARWHLKLKAVARNCTTQPGILS